MFEILVNTNPAALIGGIALVVTMIACAVASVIADEF